MPEIEIKSANIPAYVSTARIKQLRNGAIKAQSLPVAVGSVDVRHVAHDMRLVYEELLAYRRAAAEKAAQ